MQRQLKKSLNAVIVGCYIALAATVLVVGHLTPEYTQATLSALSAFFIVATLFALVPFYGLVRRLSLDSKGFKITTGVSGRHVMVAQAGPTLVGPGSCVTGSEIPVWAIASEISPPAIALKLYTGGCHNGYNPKTPKIRDPPTQLRLSP
ncbi:hypothetical protein CQX81_25670 [Salmonella enterica]|nr:hypothetical protein [Salmonella enterica]